MRQRLYWLLLILKLHRATGVPGVLGSAGVPGSAGVSGCAGGAPALHIPTKYHRKALIKQDCHFKMKE